MDVRQNAATRLGALAALFDAGTRRHLLDRGLAAGWRCLEVAGGTGSVARWLAEQVGASGRVIVTDIDTGFLDSLALSNVEVLRHDVTRDPMPPGPFDLVHARMILTHLPERDEVLARLASVLAPGGWLVCEEFDGVSAAADATASPGEAALTTQAAMQALSADRGLDRRYGRLLFGRFRALGFRELGADGHLTMVQAGSAAATLLRASYELRRDAMIDGGYLTAAEFDGALAAMTQPDFMMPSPIMWTVWGRRA